MLRRLAFVALLAAVVAVPAVTEPETPAQLLPGVSLQKQVALTPILLNPGNPEDLAELRKITPIAKLPVLVLDNGWKIPESTIIVEYIDTHGTGPRLIPEDRDVGRQTRFYDRITDLYVTAG